MVDATHASPPSNPSAVPPWGRVHVVGIGGAGMSGIARIMAAQGVAVSGSDAKDSRRLQALRAIGVDARVGHDPALIGGIDALVVSTAIPETNVERAAAREAGIPELSRAEALAAIMSGSRGIAVAGTHGKTTTTSMLTVALQACGADPSFAIGSEIHESGSNAHLGTGELFVVEADESDGAFLHLSPIAAIVTNIEPDHLDHWGTFEAIEEAFVEFASGTRERGGFVVACIDDPGAARMVERARQGGVDVRTYGVSENADFRLVDPSAGSTGWSFDAVHEGRSLGTVTLQVPGRHNALNAMAAFACGLGLGFDADRLRRGLAGFSGTRRRFEFKGQADGVRVFDDYAHHPTEIQATLRAAREVAGGGSLVVAFQAHHYYRTAMFVEEFGAALGLADDVVVLEVFAPGEQAIPGASGQTMAAHVPLAPEHVVFEPSWSAVAGHLAGRARPGDVVMTLGAGDVHLIAGEVLDLLRQRQGAA
jgi:UDP-N-acetylmuramate--alanine ligase